MTNTSIKNQAIESLRSGGIANPLRLVKLIRDTIVFLKLDLSGLVILTEAASGAYVVTPVIATMAKAKQVFALTHESQYANVKEVIAQTRALETLCEIDSGIEVYTERSLDLFAKADIVTNLGFVRPIDAEAVSVMKQSCVVPLMCEAWEIRGDDVDLDACRDKGIVVLGTNEDYPGLEVFTYGGLLCMKMLFDAQIEIHKSKIIVVSSDKFGPVIEQQLIQAGAKTFLKRSLRGINDQELAEADVLVVADYTRKEMIIGSDGDITAEYIRSVAPDVTIILFAGRVDFSSLVEYGIAVHPEAQPEAHKMSLTLAGLGPRPVIELHAAGLRVGQLAQEVRKSGLDPYNYLRTEHHTLAQLFDKRKY